MSSNWTKSLISWARLSHSVSSLLVMCMFNMHQASLYKGQLTSQPALQTLWWHRQNMTKSYSWCSRLGHEKCFVSEKNFTLWDKHTKSSWTFFLLNMTNLCIFCVFICVFFIYFSVWVFFCVCWHICISELELLWHKPYN